MWVGRQWRRVRNWLSGLSWPRRVLILAALLTAPCWLGCGGLFVRAQYIHWFVLTAEDRAFFRREPGRYSEGVPSIARRLKAEMERIPDPDSALRRHPDWAVIRFKSGEWAFGHGINSHGFNPGHGTLVVKDSLGRVRIFFGHVCGENQQFDHPGRSVQTLEAFYAKLKEYDTVREWNPDQ